VCGDANDRGAKKQAACNIGEVVKGHSHSDHRQPDEYNGQRNDPTERAQKKNDQTKNNGGRCDMTAWIGKVATPLSIEQRLEQSDHDDSYSRRKHRHRSQPPTALKQGPDKNNNHQTDEHVRIRNDY
jgi:hypothetical protein